MRERLASQVEVELNLQSPIEIVDEEAYESYDDDYSDNFSNIAVNDFKVESDSAYYKENASVDSRYSSHHTMSDDIVSEAEACTSMKAGSINSSVMNLIACTVGAGTITMPYVIALTGIAFGSILVVSGAMLSHYSSYLLIKCNQLTGMKSYEDFAEITFGYRRWRNVASVMLMTSLLGFTTAYISLCKTLIPSIIAASVTAERYA
jgi:hypothetical protein